MVTFTQPFVRVLFGLVAARMDLVVAARQPPCALDVVHVGVLAMVDGAEAAGPPPAVAKAVDTDLAVAQAHTYVNVRRDGPKTFVGADQLRCPVDRLDGRDEHKHLTDRSQAAGNPKPDAAKTTIDKAKAIAAANKRKQGATKIAEAKAKNSGAASAIKRLRHMGHPQYQSKRRHRRQATSDADDMSDASGASQGGAPWSSASGDTSGMRTARSRSPLRLTFDGWST